MPASFRCLAIAGPMPSILVKSSPPTAVLSVAVWPPRSAAKPISAVAPPSIGVTSCDAIALANASPPPIASPPDGVADSSSGKLSSSVCDGAAAASRMASRLYWTSEFWNVWNPVPAGIK